MNLAVIDLVDRDGQVRQTWPVHAWPFSIGRALDNDLVLTDPHVAAHHLVIAPDAQGLAVMVAESRNGVVLGRTRLRQGERSPVAADPAGRADMTLGRTRLRLLLAGDAVAAELPLAAAEPWQRRLAPIVFAAVLLLAMQLFGTYLGNDPDGLGRAVGAMLMTALTGAVIWCGGWSLLSKTFTRHANFAWHLRVFLFGSVGLVLLGVVPAALAFAFSWPAVTDFAFIGTFVVGGIAVYFHLLAVEPGRPRLLRAVVGLGTLTGIALTLWLNITRTDLYGDELYMSHLFPPVMRLAKTVPADHFIAGLTALKPVLDKKAKEADTSDPGPTGGDAEE